MLNESLRADGSKTKPGMAFDHSGTVTLSATSTSARVALPATGSTMIIRNAGPNRAFIKRTNASGMAAATDYPLDAYATDIVYRDPAAHTHLAGICANGGETASLSISCGEGGVSVQQMGPGAPVSSIGGATAAKQDVLAGLIGEVQASPTSNTLLDRLKSLYTALTGTLLVATNAVRVGVTLTRPADTAPYLAKDVVSDSTSAPTVLTFSNFARVNGGTGTIVRARLLTDQKTCVAQFRLHLYHTAPTAQNDNAAFGYLYANADKRIGAIDFPPMQTEDSTNSTAAYGSRPNSDASYGPPNLWFQTDTGNRNIYGILETLSAFTPASAQNFYIELGAMLD